MSRAEFVHHVAFHRLCPWGEDWKQTEAIAAATIAASPKYKRIDLAKFFPKPIRRQVKQSADYIFGFFKQMAVDAEARRVKQR